MCQWLHYPVRFWILPVDLTHTGHIIQYVKLSRETHEVIQNAVVPGSFFVDVFPPRT